MDGHGLPDLSHRLPTIPGIVKLHWELNHLTYSNFSPADPALHPVTLPFDLTQGKGLQEKDQPSGVRCVWITHIMCKENNLNAGEGLAKLQTLEQPGFHHRK